MKILDSFNQVIPMRLNIKCKNSHVDMEESQGSHEVADSARSGDLFLSDIIW